MEKNNMEISAISYTNKDFGSIYPEILDIAKQLTNEWDPANSNESDPGVVLLKEAAFVADHNNYNIDKNILENFLPSATQDISVRNICEMSGYTPRYYTSAIGDISFNWTQPESELEYQTSFTIPAFTLVVSDEEETVTYTQIENLVVNDQGPVSCKFIEGTLQTLSVNNSSVITLEDLDDNNRVYFPEVMVAQNRVFVRNYNSSNDKIFLQEDDYWVRDDYLLTRPPGNKAFKIDYDSILDLPYIEFPADISSIIGDGIVVEYISTSGKNGNISANTITKILSPSTFFAIGEDVERTTDAFSVFNSGSITNGKDPETIDEMYRSFKKIVGTFDTLVTCKDYSNKVYTLTDGNDHPIVSNAVVTDRRIDFNKSINIVTYDFNTNVQGFSNLSIKPCSLNYKGVRADIPTAADPGDMWVINEKLYVNTAKKGSPKFVDTTTINLNDFALLTEAMTPYDLVIYALKVFSLGEYLNHAPEVALNKSFTPVSGIILDNIKTDLEYNKCLSHTYNDPKSDDVFLFKNYVPLNVELETYNKIRSNEEFKIVDNICKAISEEFNPRKLEYGEKIDVDRLKKVIIDADSRIKNAKINPLEYNTRIMLGNGEEKSLDDIISSSTNTTYLVDIIAKNVLSGRVCLFNFDNNFKFDYGQQKLQGGSIFTGDNIKSETVIRLEKDESQSNTQSTYLKFDTKYTVKQSGSNFNYKYNLNAPSLSEGYEIGKNMSYELKENDEFKIWVYDFNNTSNNGTILSFKPDKYVSYTITNIDSNIQNTLSDSNPHTLPNNSSFKISVNTIQKDTDLKFTNLNNYTVNKNECIQILSPNYLTDTTYSTYVNYKYINASNPDGYIPANIDYSLTKDESIVLIYSIDGIEKQEILTAGTIVNVNFTMYVTDSLTNNVYRKEWVDNAGEIHNDNFKQLTSNQTISTKKLMQTKLNSTDIWCYWILGESSYEYIDGKPVYSYLFKNDETEKILGNDEYFIYTNSSLNEMIILGAGTKLQKPTESSQENQWRLEIPDISIDSISKYGTSIQNTINWKRGIDFAMYPMYITEMAVVTLSEGDSISIYGWNDIPERVKDVKLNTTTYLNGDWTYCNGSIIYKISSSKDAVTLPYISNHYQIRTRLDLNMSAESPQLLKNTPGTKIVGDTEVDDYDNPISVERILINPTSTPKKIEPNTEDIYIQSSEPIYKIGGNIKFENPVSFYGYTVKKSDGSIVIYDKSFLITVNNGTKTYDFFYSTGENNSKTCLIPIHVSGNGKTITLSAKRDGSNINLVEYNSTNEPTTAIELIGTQSYYIKLPNGSGNVALTFSWPGGALKENQSVVINNIVVFDGINKEIKPSNVLTPVLERMREITSGSDKPSERYYYPYKPDNSIIMDNLNFEDVDAFWDKNNLANRFTLPQIDLKNSIIKVVASMKRD